MSGDQFELFERALWWDLDWSKTAKSRSTRPAFKRIASFWAARFVDELARQDMVSLREHLIFLGLKPNTVNTHHTMVTRWMTWLFECKDAGLVHGMDFRPISLPKKNVGSEVPKVDEKQFNRNIAWPKEVVHKLVAAAQRVNDQFMADVVETLYITMLRPGDVWEIERRNVDMAHKVLQGIQHKSIRRSMPSGLPYSKVITPRLEVIFRRRLALTAPGAPLFRDPEYAHEAWRRQMGRRFDVLRTAAQLPHVNLRDFRPSAATLSLDNGVDVETLRLALGHSTSRQLPTYARRTLAHLRLAQEKLEDSESDILV